jgi:hypothetical protein
VHAAGRSTPPASANASDIGRTQVARQEKIMIGSNRFDVSYLINTPEMLTCTLINMPPNLHI